MPRDMFIQPGILEPKDQQKHRESDVRIKQDEHGWFSSKTISEADIEQARSDFFEGIDFETLKQIFSELYEKCGIDKSSLNLLKPDRIIFFPFTNQYQADDNFIRIRPLNLKNWKDSNIEEGRKIAAATFGSVDLYMLTVLIHEETHAVSQNTCVGFNEETRGSAYSQSGYDRLARPQSAEWDNTNIHHFQGRSIADKDRSVVIFNTLNEGVVEKLSRELCLEYLKRSGHSESKIATYKKIVEKNPPRSGYAHEVALINLMVDKMAKYADITEQTVWRALIKGLLQGEVFNDPEVQELFEKAFGKKFLKDLSDIGSLRYDKKKFYTLIHKYFKAHLPPIFR